MAEADYGKNNPAPDVEWWTAEEYEKWIAIQEEELEALISASSSSLITKCSGIGQLNACAVLRHCFLYKRASLKYERNFSNGKIKS